MSTFVLPKFNAFILTPEQKSANVLNERKSRLMSREAVLIAALIFVLAIGVLMLVTWNKSLYSKYEISNNTIVNSLNNTPHKDFHIAATYFDNGHYFEARQIIYNHYVKNPDDHKLSIQYASLLIAADCFETSRQVLYPTFNSGTNEFKGEAAYLLALSYLKESKYAYTQQWLAKVPKGTVYHHQAAELLQKIASQAAN